MTRSIYIRFLMGFLFSGCLVWLSAMAVAQELLESVPSSNSPACVDAEVSAKPTRPNLTYSTDTTQCGVVEADYGWTWQWSQDGVRQNFFSGSLRVGVTRNLDVRWGGMNFVSLQNGPITAKGTGDNWVGFRYRFLDRATRFPSLGISYDLKVPTASPEKGLGTGYVDHDFILLASKDAGRFHFDFNLVDTLAGKQSGFQASTAASLACWRPLTKRLAVVTESYGGSQSVGNPFASVLAGAAYSVSPKFVMDAALETPITGSSPGKQLIFGATYAVGNLYRWFQVHPAR